MTFAGFSKQDFDTFKIEGLELRMEAIQDKIQPKFRHIGEHLLPFLTSLAGNEMFLHIARHARRTVNPPKDTWLAICHDKKGYKKHPHFQFGLFDDHVFIWLAFIYELPDKSKIASRLIEASPSILNELPSDFVISQDHTQKKSESISEFDWKRGLERFRDIKKAELLIGKQLSAEDIIGKDGNYVVSAAEEVFEKLFPLYRLAMK